MSQKATALPVPDQATDYLKALIDQQRWLEAAALGEQVASLDIDGYEYLGHDARFCFTMSLAYHLSSNEVLAVIWHEAAKNGKGYTKLMEYDFSSDAILTMIRLDRTDGNTLTHIQTGFSFTKQQADWSRHARWIMLRGLHCYMLGEFDFAEQDFAIANAIWRDIGDEADAQVMQDNRFYWMRAAARLGHPMSARQLAAKIIAEPEYSKNHKRLARLVMKLSPDITVWLYDQRERRKIRR